MKTITQLPLVIVDRFKSYRLFSQDFRDIDQLATPFDLALVTHLPDRDSGLVLHFGEFGRIGAWREAMDASWRFSFQRLMRAVPVIFLLKRIIVLLLRLNIFLRCHCFLQGSMHPFVAAVLGWFPRLDPLRLDAQLDPPFRELTDAAQCKRSERRSVVSADHFRQPGFAKDPLKPILHFLVSRSLERPTQKQIAREVVANGQRITAATITQQKVSFKVCTPTLIGCATRSEGLGIGRYPSPPLTGFHQTRTLQDFAGRRIRWPLKFRTVLAQQVHQLFRAPVLALKLGLHNQRSQLFWSLIRMTVRRTSQFLKSWQPPLLITRDPFISGRSADLVDSAKFAFAIFSTQPIRYQLNSLVHDSGFLPRHRQAPPCRRNVNHVPGLFCKLCARFVPSPNPSQREGDRKEIARLIIGCVVTRTLRLP